MKLIPNDDSYTSAFVADGWASFGFDYLDDLDEDQETTDAFGTDKSFNY